MKMQKVGFTYPGAAKATLNDVTVRCNLNSRVAVLGVSPPPFSPPLPTQIPILYCLAHTRTCWFHPQCFHE